MLEIRIVGRMPLDEWLLVEIYKDKRGTMGRAGRKGGRIFCISPIVVAIVV